MNLFYDATLLGIGYRNHSGTGLIRTAENLLLSLIEIEEIKVTLCSSLSFEIWQYSRQYLNQNTATTALDFVRPEMTRSKIYQNLSGFQNSREQGDNTHQRFFRKILRNLLEINFNPLRNSDLEGIDIYHSPYHRLPECVKHTKHLKCFLTVHDIIPIIHPEFFGLRKNFTAKDFDKEYNLLQALESLDRETWIICPSQCTKEDLCQYMGSKIDNRKAFVIPWAASALFYQCSDTNIIASMRRKYGIPEGPYILSLSTLEPRKNIEQVIRCYAQLVVQENLTDLSLVLAGFLGWNYESIFQEISNFSDLKERIIFTGYVADEDLAPLYSDALVFVYPSFYEGFGLPPLEAMQCGTPVITSNTSSLPEVVGDAGMMVDPHDLEGLCQSILVIYTNASLRNELSKKSIEQAKQFSWATSAQQTAAAYRKALG